MDSYKWFSTGYPGVWYRTHKQRKIPNSSLKDRYYCICYRHCGKLKWEAIGWQTQGATLENAIKILATVKSAIREGKEFKTLRQKRREAQLSETKREQEKQTLWDYYINHYRPKISSLYKESSFKRVESIFNKWLIPYFGNIKLKDINLHHWDALMEAMTKSSLTSRTKVYISGELTRLLKYAKERGLTVQPIPNYKQIGILHTKNNRRERIITPEEGRLIMEYLYKKDINAFRVTKFAFLTGCRFSECANLKWENCGNNFIIFTNTKNKSNRRITITEEIDKLLNDIKQENPSGYVFLNSKGTRYAQPPKAFKKATDYLELNKNRHRLDKITFHSIRHTVATLLAESLDIRSLMDFMGWKGVEMATVYIHSNENKIKSAAENLKNLYGDEV